MRGPVWRGSAWPVGAMRGKARQGSQTTFERGEAWLGPAERGQARRCMDGRGRVLHGRARRGLFRWGVCYSASHHYHGAVRPGEVRQGMAGRGRLGEELKPTSLGAWLGKAVPGGPRKGEA
jgi:hypothetical protein